MIIEWDPPASDGGSAILGYQLYMKLNSDATWDMIYDGE
jgi:hypothetical protein